MNLVDYLVTLGGWDSNSRGNFLAEGIAKLGLLQVCCNKIIKKILSQNRCIFLIIFNFRVFKVIVTV